MFNKFSYKGKDLVSMTETNRWQCLFSHLSHVIIP